MNLPWTVSLVIGTASLMAVWLTSSLLAALAMQSSETRALGNDPFGYLEQLDAYLLGSVGDDLVTVKDRAYLLAIDKQLGHMCLYEHQLRAQHIRSRISAYKDIVSLDTPPVCECGTVPDGKSGNIRLDTKASYNIYKHTCFPNLRTFLYASGPVYLTKVVRKPDVPEVDKFGQLVYN
jgi:hypothetical protein